MNRTALAAGAVAAGLAIAAYAGVRLADSSGDRPPTAAAPEPAVPRLDAAARRAATQAARADPDLARLSNGQELTVAAIGPWTTADDAPLGASMIVRWTRPVDFRGRLPAIRLSDGEAPSQPFTEHRARVVARGVRAALVRVALPSRRVVTVEPHAQGG